MVGGRCSTWGFCARRRSNASGFAWRVQYCADEGAHRSTKSCQDLFCQRSPTRVSSCSFKRVSCAGDLSAFQGLPSKVFQGAGMSHKGVSFQRVSSKGRLSRVCPTRASQKSVLQEYHEGSLQGVSAEHLPSLTGVAEKPFQRSVFETFESSQGCLGKVSGTVPCASVHRSLKRVLAGLPHQGVPQSAHKERPSGVANTLEEHLRQAPLSKRVSWEEPLQRALLKSARQGRLTGVSSHRAAQECPARVSQKNASLEGLICFVRQGCLTGVSYRSVFQDRITSQERSIRLNDKSSVFRNCVLGASCKHHPQSVSEVPPASVPGKCKSDMHLQRVSCKAFSQKGSFKACLQKRPQRVRQKNIH